MTCIIIEDEPLAMERTRSYIQKLPHLQLLKTFDSSLDALVFLNTQETDLIFLDINMGELSGIQLLEALKPRCAVILTTAYDQYALKGFELQVTDYLLKPFSFERFYQAVKRAEASQVGTGTQTSQPFIFVKTEYRLEKVDLNEILYIEGMRDYRRIHTREKRIMTLQNFKDFETEISPALICRVHKSYMVSLCKIASIERDRIRIGEVLIPLSETYKKAFLGLIQQQKKQ
jgi:two-component system LytT family response regulator